MSLEQDLLKDLDSDFESSDEQQEQQLQQEEENTNINQTTSAYEGNGNTSHIEIRYQTPLSQVSLDEIEDITKHTTLPVKIQPVLSQIEEYLGSKYVSKSKESSFLSTVNSLSLEVSEEVKSIHSFIKLRYHKKYAELESLFPNAVEYARLVKILGNELKVEENDRLGFISREKLLMLSMSTLQALKSGKHLTELEVDQINKACDLLLSLTASKERLSSYISGRLAVLAPNVTAIVGPDVASQFLTALGSLEKLASTPACNLPSLGSSKHSIGLRHVTNEDASYLANSDIIQSTPEEFRKQAMRIVSGKITLAARIDLSNSLPDGSQGRKWRTEIETKIEKLGQAPEQTKIKALPVPVEQKAKKRAGRKVRKLKAKFELSELRKAQNIMVFGKKETTITDSYGEEIGLGITGSLSKIPINSGNKAKVTKAMKDRLDKSRVQGKLTEDIFNQDFINLQPSNGK